MTEIYSFPKDNVDVLLQKAINVVADSLDGRISLDNPKLQEMIPKLKFALRALLKADEACGHSIPPQCETAVRQSLTKFYNRVAIEVVISGLEEAQIIKNMNQQN